MPGRIRAVFITAFIVLAANCCTAQLSNKALGKTIIIKSKQVRIDSLIKIFSRQTGVEFSFNSKKISPSSKLMVPAKSITLAEWLTTINQIMGVQHRIVGNHIILIDNSTKKVSKVEKKLITTPQQKLARPITSSTAKPKLLPQKAGTDDKAKTDNRQLIAASETNNKQDTAPGDALQKIQPDSIQIVHDTTFTAATQSIAGRDTSQQVQDSGKTLQLPGKPVIQNVAEHQAKKQTKERKAGRTDARLMKPLTKIDLGLQGVGISFERRLGRRSIIDFSAGLGGGYAVTSDDFTYTLNFSAPELYISVNPRFYYNTQKRLNQNKSIAANAGNYWGIRLKFVSESLVKDIDGVYTPKGFITVNGPVWQVVLLNVHWGIQRPIGKRWLVNAHAGPGFAIAGLGLIAPYNFAFNRVYPSLETKFSYHFNK